MMTTRTARRRGRRYLTFGQVDSALVVGDSIKAIEKVVAKLTGGSVRSVGDTAEFQGSEKAASFRGSYAFGWVNVAAVSGVLGAGADMLRPQAAALGIDPRKALAAFGIDGLRSLAFSAQQTPEGSFGIFAAGVPEAKRTGLFKLFAFEPKDSAPPAFVPADAVKFQRWRLNGQKTWAALESMLSEVSPQLGGFLQMSISALGKDKDPNFDFKKAFVGNLGDDYVTSRSSPAPPGNRPPARRRRRCCCRPPSRCVRARCAAPCRLLQQRQRVRLLARKGIATKDLLEEA